MEGGQAGANRAEQPADPFKIAPDYRFILRVRCHSHQPAKPDMTIRLPFAHRPHSSIGFWGTSGVRRRFGNPEQGEDFGLREAMLGFLRAQMEFQEDGNDPVIGSAPLLNGIQKVDGIHRLNHRGIWQDQLEFIGLEVTDEMPFYIGRHLRNLGSKLLRPVLTEQPLPGSIGFLQGRYRVELGHGHQPHPLREHRPYCGQPP